MAWTIGGDTVANNGDASIGIEDRGGGIYHWMLDPDGDWSDDGAERIDLGPARFWTASIDSPPVELGADQPGALTLAEAVAVAEGL